MLKVIMSVLTNIKYQYNLRILQDFISSNNYSDFFAQLEKLKGNNKLYTQLLTTLGSSAILDNKLIFSTGTNSLSPPEYSIFKQS